MTAPFRNPALEWFAGQIGDELLVAQVVIRRDGATYELRHVADRDVSAERLQVTAPENARMIVQFTEAGAFRPLKSAPNLKRGWRILCRSDAELELALNRLYPGAVADLYATRDGSPPVTNYREFTNRQTGMYRITTFLNDADAARVISRCCAPDSCLKRRLWSVNGLAIDRLEAKSIIPCLEPCAVLLEYARKVVRATQRENASAAQIVPKLTPDSKAAEHEE
jgi:hypothetical protein